jgi:hypothetical protein
MRPGAFRRKAIRGPGVKSVKAEAVFIDFALAS